MYTSQQQVAGPGRSFSDPELINLWLQRQAPNVRRSYWQVVQAFMKFVRKPLAQVTQADIDAFASSLGDRYGTPLPYLQKRLEAVHSLLRFGQKIGWLPKTPPETIRPMKRPRTRAGGKYRQVESYFSSLPFGAQLGLSVGMFFSLGAIATLIVGMFQGGALAKRNDTGSGSIFTTNREWLSEAVAVMPEIKPAVSSQDDINNPKIRAFLDTISVTEGTTGPEGYRTQYTGSKFFGSYDKHPRELKCSLSNGRKLCSDAAGRYQFLSTSWDHFGRRIGISKFTPTNQDRVAVELIRDKGVLDDILEGRLEKAFKELAPVWPSFGSNDRAVRASMPKLKEIYRRNLARYHSSEVAKVAN